MHVLEQCVYLNKNSCILLQDFSKMHTATCITFYKKAHVGVHFYSIEEKSHIKNELSKKYSKKYPY